MYTRTFALLFNNTIVLKMKSRNNLTIGQAVYVKIRESKSQNIGDLMELSVLKIGNKYITVGTEKMSKPFIFEHGNSVAELNTSFIGRGELYLTKEDYDNETRQRELAFYMYKQFSTTSKLPLDKLERIYAIINEPNKIETNA